MAGIPLAPELCGQIALSASSRRGDLAALCLTCKAFQREAEIKLYENLVFVDPQKAHLACRTVIAHERLAVAVRSFWFSQEPRRPPPLGQAFWLAIQGALNRMHNLEFVSLSDPSFCNSWIFDPTHIQFQLREAKLRLTWDANLIRFLETQRKLRSLHIIDNLEDFGRPEIQTGSLPALQVFDGTLMIGVQFLSSPLTHLQMTIDAEVAPELLAVLPRLGKAHKTLRGLSLLDIPEEVASRTLSVVSSTCPTLRHIGLIPLTSHNRHKFHHSLIHMHYLRSIQLEVTRWTPHPSTAAQRAVAAEIRMFCPSVRLVIFWINTTRFRWVFGNEWHSQIDAAQYPQYDNLWCSA